MPLFELEATRASRVCVFLRAQLPFLLGVLFVTAMVAVGHPASLTAPIVIVGVALTVLASLAALLVPWESLRPTWMIVISIADIVAVAFLRAELTSVMPSVGMLSIFPVLWIAYGFPRPAILAAVAGAGFITSFTFVYQGRVPSTAAEWINIIMLPTLIIGVALVVSVAAGHLRRSRSRLLVAHASESAALRRAVDNEILAGTILNTVQAAVMFFDPDGRLVVANRRATELSVAVGIPLDETLHTGAEIYAADRVTRVPPEEQAIPRALRGENIAERLEWAGPPDRQLALNTSARRVHRETGERLGTVIVAHDVTELAVALSVREQFLKTVSHELRTPLTNIIGYLDLIAERLDAADRTGHDYLAIVLRNVDALMDRIRELRAASRSSVPLAPQHVDVTTLVDGAIADVRERADARGMTIERVGTTPLHAHVDPWRMRQAIRELLTNAIKFGHAHSAITIGQSGDAHVCRVSVTNVGPEIGGADQRHIFDSFYRASYAHENAIQGFGIGLTMVRDVVAAHDGHVMIDRPTSGTTRFTVEVAAG
ncbi:PAS domain-containing sensor histidine kinase [Microbacterium sp. 18062]|uniref:sensor histidine kinase n=1 Tax=Microbacterium sp. 18062 TaxID=2681410 RepID=UPI00135AFA39|nr:PAS domain-containing sensor histidine kinase [Microbacterium sp. 18062]